METIVSVPEFLTAALISALPDCLVGLPSAYGLPAVLVQWPFFIERRGNRRVIYSFNQQQPDGIKEHASKWKLALRGGVGIIQDISANMNQPV